jgi:hypothetical protein
MGYNTTVIVLNDALHEIEKDKEFGAKLALAIMKSRPGHREDISSNYFVNAASVIATQHADITSVVAIGGNHGTELGSFFNNGHHHTEEDKIKLLKDLADKFGYRLVKKRKIHWKKKLIGKSHAFDFGDSPIDGTIKHSICGKHLATYNKNVPKLLGDKLKPRCKICEKILYKITKLENKNEN